jgi:hypothetical protein
VGQAISSGSESSEPTTPAPRIASLNFGKTVLLYFILKINYIVMDSLVIRIYKYLRKNQCKTKNNDHISVTSEAMGRNTEFAKQNFEISFK